MKLALNTESAQALRTLAGQIPDAMSDILSDTEELLTAYRSLCGTLGVHEESFLELVESVARACETGQEAILRIPGLLIATAENIEAYVRSQPQAVAPQASASSVPPMTEEQLVGRTVLEFEALAESLELTDGDPGILQLGGPYSAVKKQVDSRLYEVHHIPPKAVFSDSRYALPAIAMRREDHAKTSSFRARMRKSHESFLPGTAPYPKHADTIRDLVGKGMFAESVRNEIFEIRDAFGTRYDGAIRAFLQTMCQYISANGIPELKEPH